LEVAGLLNLGDEPLVLVLPGQVATGEEAAGTNETVPVPMMAADRIAPHVSTPRDLAHPPLSCARRRACRFTPVSRSTRRDHALAGSGARCQIGGFVAGS
jgi:hypothetical protein